MTVHAPEYPSGDGGSNPAPSLQDSPELFLEFCSRSDPRYVAIRDRHYIGNLGAHGQQVHFLIHYKSAIVGIISGGSPVFGTAPRDKFFGITGYTKKTKTRVLNGIVNNTVFRLETREKNLATRVLALWREIVPYVWKEMYGAEVYGFETLIIPEGGETTSSDGSIKIKRTAEDVEQLINADGSLILREGHLYRADNWTFAGNSSGSSKSHRGQRGGLTGGLRGTPFIRDQVTPKPIWVKWRKGFSKAIECDYKSSWKGNTPEEKILAKQRTESRKKLTGLRFHWKAKKGEAWR